MIDPVLHFRALPALYCKLHRDPSNSLSRLLNLSQSMRLSHCFRYRKDWWCRHNLCCKFFSTYHKYSEFHFPEYRRNQSSGNTFLHLLLEVPVGLHKTLLFPNFTWLCFQGLENLFFYSSSMLCFCAFCPGCLFPTFLKDNLGPNPSATLFGFLVSHT